MKRPSNIFCVRYLMTQKRSRLRSQMIQYPCVRSHMKQHLYVRYQKTLKRSCVRYQMTWHFSCVRYLLALKHPCDRFEVTPKPPCERYQVTLKSSSVRYQMTLKRPCLWYQMPPKTSFCQKVNDTKNSARHQKSLKRNRMTMKSI